MTSQRSGTLGQEVGKSALLGIALTFLAGTVSGCRAHASAKAQVNTSSEADDDHKYEMPESSQPSPPPGTRPLVAPPPSEPPADRTYFLGVVHDLALSADAARTPACRCLAVAYGSPTDAKFAWHGGAPQLEPGTMAVAIAADGVACNAPGFAPRRASIAGVEVSGDDVVVVVENVREGRPVVRGALVVPPGGKGSLVIRARRGAPYGTPAAGGSGPCRIAAN